MILDAVFLFSGIAMLLVVLQLRAMLSLEFPKLTAWPLPSLDQLPEGIRPVFAAAEQSLIGLGFRESVWLLTRQPESQGDVPAPMGAAQHPESGTIAWIIADPMRPHMPLLFLVTRLADGRQAITQSNDIYFHALGLPDMPAQTVITDDIPELVDQHQRWVAGLGNVSTNIELLKRDEAARACEKVYADIRSQLTDAGKLVERHGAARLNFLAGLGMLWKFWFRQRPKPDPRPVGWKRLGLLAASRRAITFRSPSAQHQWILMAASTALSLIIGTPIIGLELTVIILFVIVFHELGHWAAMRAFGYRNPHITLLPLLGGVTIGHETDSDPAKRSWVSLAGPLPGILLAWIILIAAFFTGSLETAPDWFLPLVGMLLFINYLNVIPIPPLDGSHVLRALLPAHWLNVQVWLVVLGILLGVAVGFAFGFWILSFLALLQLLTVPAMLRVNETVRAVENFPTQDASHAVKMKSALVTLEKRFGEAANATQRIADAEAVVSILGTRPFKPLQRLLVTGTTLFLLAGPVIASGFYFGSLYLFSDSTFGYSDEDETDFEARLAASEAQQELLTAEAENHSIPTLLSRLVDDQPAPLAPPASSEAIAGTESRFGSLSPDIKALYGWANGIPQMGFGPIESVATLGSNPEAKALLTDYGYEGELWLWSEAAGDTVAVAIDSLDSWLVLGMDDGVGLILWTRQPAEAVGGRLIAILDEPALADDLGSWLRDQWVAERMWAYESAESDRRHESKVRELEDLTVAELLDRFEGPTWFERRLGIPGWPDPIDDAEAEAIQSRIGYRFPSWYRELLDIHNGFPPLMLLGADQLRQFEPSLHESSPLTVQDSGPVMLKVAGGDAEIAVDREVFAACLTIGGISISDPEHSMSYYRELWCPEYEYPLLDLDDRVAYRSTRDFLVDATAAQLIF